MFGKLTIAFLLVIQMYMASCSKSAEMPISGLEGTWVLKNVFLSDALDGPCSSPNYQTEITLKFSIDSTDAEKPVYRISGKSAVNSYFGSFEIAEFDTENDSGIIKFSPIGSTKMAGPEELMRCESRYFSYFKEETDFSFDFESPKPILRIGTFRKPDSHPRDGGYFLIFEKK